VVECGLGIFQTRDVAGGEKLLQGFG
jgi:hypothetical protein